MTFKLHFFITLLMILGLIISCSNSSKKTPVIKKIHHESNKKIDSNLENSKIKGYIRAYLNLKNTLVNDDKENSSKNWLELENELNKLSFNSNETQKQNEFMLLLNETKLYLKQINITSIESQRISFELISQKLLLLIKITGSEVKLYEHYCPMFNKNKGGIWISSNKEIFNPLFGSSMLKCGYVKSEIN